MYEYIYNITKLLSTRTGGSGGDFVLYGSATYALCRTSFWCHCYSKLLQLLVQFILFRLKPLLVDESKTSGGLVD